jgi:hypothetical protein
MTLWQAEDIAVDEQISQGEEMTMDAQIWQEEQMNMDEQIWQDAQMTLRRQLVLAEGWNAAEGGLAGEACGAGPPRPDRKGPVEHL